MANEHADKIRAAVDAAQHAPEDVRAAVVEGLTKRCFRPHHIRGCVRYEPCEGPRCKNCGGSGRIPRDWPDYALLGALRYGIRPVLTEFIYGTPETMLLRDELKRKHPDLPAALDALRECLEAMEVQE